MTLPIFVFLMNNYSGNETINAGTGKELTIKALTELVAKVVGYEGEILWDTTRPNGTPRKLKKLVLEQSDTDFAKFVGKLVKY